MTNKALRVGIAGCGNIAGPYAKTMKNYPQVELAGATDVLPGRAEQLTTEHGGRAYATLDEMLADRGIDLVVNLTIHHHPAVITQCLNAGKHVHSEKPLAMNYTGTPGNWSIWRRRAAAELLTDHLHGRGAERRMEGDPHPARQGACGLLRGELGARRGVAPEPRALLRGGCALQRRRLSADAGDDLPGTGGASPPTARCCTPTA